MTSPADRCPDVGGELEAFSLGQLAEADAACVRKHLRACASCRAEFEEVRALFLLADEIESIEPTAAFRRRMDAWIENEVGPRSQADRGAVAAVLTLVAFAGARFRASRRFRYVTMAAAAHVLVLAVLTFFVIPAAERDRVSPIVRALPEDFVGRTLENQEIADGLDGPPIPVPEEIVDGAIEEILPPVETSPRLEPGLPDPDSSHRRFGALRRFPTPRMAAYLADRLDGERKERRVREARGDLRTLASIRAALGWLAKAQEKDGSWSPGRGYAGYREGVTGLALLALLADGHSVRRGDHREVVARGVGFLRRRQRGGLIADPKFDRPMYGHAIATLALIEFWGVDYEHMTTGRISLRRDIKAAVEVIVGARKADGGWRYRPRRGASDRTPGDVSVTIWQVLALSLARDAGFSVSHDILDDGRAFIEARSRPEDGAVGYQSISDLKRPLDATLTAGTLLVAMDLAFDRERTALRRAFVRQAVPGEKDVRNPLLWFYATAGLRRHGDVGLADWTGFTTRTLLPAQDADGSWPPEALYGQQGGRVYTTALGALVLSVDFRDARRP